MKRKSFMQIMGGGALGLAIPSFAFDGSRNIATDDFSVLADNLLQQWCEAMYALQVSNTGNESLHGSLSCPACTDAVHGRCMDAVYPFLYMADVHGEKKYIQAAVDVVEWANRNVSASDGSWRVIPKEGSWAGITVFGAIALADALHLHGHVLPENVREQFMRRLASAAEYVYRNFNLSFTNINYGITGTYALHMFGHMLDKPAYLERSKELALEIPNWISRQNHLIVGEAKPSDAVSVKGLRGIDLGYNVEETLNGLVLYALEANDTALLALAEKSLLGHLQFMLPDGGWDNSWGTRQYKWSYWGSRTTDGCLPAYGLMAHRNPVFGAAAYHNTMLLQACTHHGLLHGGPHFVSAGEKPCVHHTFCHAKSLARFLDAKKNVSHINGSLLLPRQKFTGVKKMPEADVYLINKNNWIATVSAYDFKYQPDAQAAAGGALAMVYHKMAGPLFAASMAQYREVEVYNQQPNPTGSICLTPRVEVEHEGVVYNNLYALDATVTYTEQADKVLVQVNTGFYNKQYMPYANGNNGLVMQYEFSEHELTIKVIHLPESIERSNVKLILPVISQRDEVVASDTDGSLQITKGKSIVKLESNGAISTVLNGFDRVFNQVPGFEALPLVVTYNKSSAELFCTVTIKQVKA